MGLDELSTEQQLGLVGAAAIVVGAFLPWLEASIAGTTITRTGINHDGIVTLALGFAAIVVIAFAEWRDAIKGLMLALGGLVSAMAAVYIADPLIFGYEGPEAQRQLAESTISAGSGLYVTLLGGLLLVFASAIALNDSLTGDFAAPATDVDE
ncbi:hypothetical protein [Natronoarchaeum rubrum]|uniref:hypothetical protein n=1 Tax=Natronoarchaeum rubrum TaxID=755311 RepID=UPI00211213DC|nr:hypothetical protein [Natronoarchaeum rubrum]